MDAITRKRVLVADDDTSSARRLVQLLREDGYEVELVHDGAGAIARLSRGPGLDVVLADYRLPHADGLAILRYARSRGPARLVMVTSYVELVQGLLRPEDADIELVAKPIRYDELERLLAGARFPVPPAARPRAAR
jgi:two-component system response regulator MprA